MPLLFSWGNNGLVRMTIIGWPEVGSENEREGPKEARSMADLPSRGCFQPSEWACLRQSFFEGKKMLGHYTHLFVVISANKIYVISFSKIIAISFFWLQGDLRGSLGGDKGRENNSAS